MLSRLVMFVASFQEIESYFIKISEVFALHNKTTECLNFENLDKMIISE